MKFEINNRVKLTPIGRKLFGPIITEMVNESGGIIFDGYTCLGGGSMYYIEYENKKGKSCTLQVRDTEERFLELFDVKPRIKSGNNHKLTKMFVF